MVTLGSINFVEIGWPYFTYLTSLSKLKEKARAKRAAEWGLFEHSTIVLDSEEILKIKNSDDLAINLPFADNMIDEYIEIIIYLGYVLLLTSSAPLTPIFVMLLLLFEKFVDTYKFYNLERRQFLHAYSGVKVCSYMLRITLYLGTLVNFSLTLFSRNFVDNGSDTISEEEKKQMIFLTKMFVLITCENLVFLFDYLISYKVLY